MANYYPPSRSTVDPGATLDSDPCTSFHCKSEHELFALIVQAMIKKFGSGDSDSLALGLEKVKTFRGISRIQGLQFMFNSFDSETQIVALADPDLPCIECLSDQKLWELFLFYWQQNMGAT